MEVQNEVRFIIVILIECIIYTTETIVLFDVSVDTFNKYSVIYWDI